MLSISKEKFNFELPFVWQEVMTEANSHEEIDSDSAYIEVQEENDRYVPADELDADSIGNLKKHKARTDIKDFGYKGLG